MKTKTQRWTGIGALLFIAAAISLAACGGDDADADPTATASPDSGDSPAAETSVDVSLTEFVIAPSVASVPPGAVTFNVSSDGAIFHNLKVVATDLAPDGLPVDDALFAVDEEQVDVVGGTEDLDPGETEELTVELAAGDYVLICNIPTHYDAGMATAFNVE